MRWIALILTVLVALSPAIALGQTNVQKQAAEAFKTCREIERYGEAIGCWQLWLEKHRAHGHEAEVLVAEERVAAASAVEPPKAAAPVPAPATTESSQQVPATTANVAPAEPVPEATPGATDLPAASTLLPLPPPAPTAVLEDTPRFQLSPALGYGGSTVVGESGATFGVFGMHRLSKQRGNTMGVAFLVSHALSEPESTTTVLGGFHMGHIVYVQGLAGLVTSPRISTDEFFGETTSSSEPTFGLGFSFGVHGEISRVFGFNVEVFGVKGVGAEGLVAGLLVGPTFQFYRRKASGDS